MELKEVLQLVKGKETKVGLCYVGDKDYVITTKQEILKTENDNLKNCKVKSIIMKKIKNTEFLGIKIFKK